VASGRGLAKVVAVGEATELGRLGRSLATITPPPTRLQRHTRRLTERLTVLALAVCAALAVVQGSLSIGLGLWLLLRVIPGLNGFLLLRPLAGLISYVLPVSLLLLLVSGRCLSAQGADPARSDRD
jgi:magnesium-transporting ATPase (P-type)